MKSTQINARGLTHDEIQAAIDSAVHYKNSNVIELYGDLKAAYLELIALDVACAEEFLKCIKQYHPEVLKDI